MSGVANIAFIGLGTMGRGMVANLAAAGYSLTVWNRTPREVDLPNVVVAETIADAVAEADIVMYCLSDDSAVSSVVLGEDGIAAHVTASSTVVDLSTISYDMHVRERDAFAELGVAFVDAPVFGSRGEAEEGGLWVVAGGADADLERVSGPLAAIAESVHRMGPSGSGVRMKLVGNYLVLSQLTGLGTALSIAKKSGLSLPDVLGVLHVTDFKSPIFDGVGASVLEDDYAPHFAAALALKDARLLQTLGQDLDVAVPVAELAVELLERAVGQGWGGLNASALVKVTADDAGVDLAN